MQRSITLSRLFAVIVFAAVSHAAWGTLGADEIMRRAYELGKVAALKSEAEMILEDANGQRRERGMSIVSKLQGNRIDTKLLIRFNAPADIKGTAFLQIEHAGGADDLWIYLPALHKSRRLVANNRRDSFFGSDFSYGDILPPNPDRYRHRLVRTETGGTQQYYVIESTPKDESTKSDSGYSKKVSWVGAEPNIEAKIEYYDEGGNLIKTQHLSEFLPAGSKDRYLPLKREMIDHRSGHKTLFRLRAPRFDAVIPDNQFSPRVLTQ